MNDSLPDDTNESEDVAPKAELEPEHKDNHQTESSVESGEQNITSENIQFTFNAYNEDIVITGAKNSGKSYLANTIVKSLNNITCFVWDFNHQFHDSRSMLFNDLDELLDIYDKAKKGRYILQPFDKSKPMFEKFCNAIFERGNIVAVFDELHLMTSKQAILKPFNNLILSGRPRGISCISISTRSASLPNNVLSNAQHVFAFRLNLQSDVEFLEQWMGEGVWQLLPIDKRKKLQNERELPEHTFYYRNQDAKTGVIGKV